MAGKLRKYLLTFSAPVDNEQVGDIAGYHLYLVKSGETIVGEKPTVTGTYKHGEDSPDIEIDLTQALRDLRNNDPTFESHLYDIHLFSVDAVGNEASEADVIGGVKFDFTPPPKFVNLKLH